MNIRVYNSCDELLKIEVLDVEGKAEYVFYCGPSSGSAFTARELRRLRVSNSREARTFIAPAYDVQLVW